MIIRKNISIYMYMYMYMYIDNLVECRLRILRGDAKIWILSSSGENNILRMSEANE